MNEDCRKLSREGEFCFLSLLPNARRLASFRLVGMRGLLGEIDRVIPAKAVILNEACQGVAKGRCSGTVVFSFVRPNESLC